MAFQNIDLCTRAGAENAANIGSIGCFVATALTVFNGVMTVSSAGMGAVAPLALAGLSLEALLFLVCGLRLRAGKGAYLSLAAVALVSLELLGRLVGLAVMGVLVHVMLLIVIVNGSRGAWALKRDGFRDHVAPIVD